MQPNHLNHLSRWGHWAAGRWLADHAEPSELVLDTRGWARFVSGHPGYDYWHVRQALTDSHLSYIVVGLDELEARSARAETLKALLAYAATPLVEFPAFPGRSDARRSALSLPPARHLGRTGPVSYGSLWQRWVRGVSWTWVNEQLPRAAARRPRRDRHEPREPRSLSRQARPLDGAGGSARSRSAAAGLPEAAFSAPLARAAGRALRPGGPALARRRGMGSPRARAGRWGSTSPRSSPPASASARGPACRAS